MQVFDLVGAAFSTTQPKSNFWRCMPQDLGSAQSIRNPKSMRVQFAIIAINSNSKIESLHKTKKALVGWRKINSINLGFMIQTIQI